MKKLILIILATILLSGCAAVKETTYKEVADFCAKQGLAPGFFVESQPVEHARCQTVGDACRHECSYTFKGLVEPKTSTSHADTVSQSVLACIQDCKSEFEPLTPQQ
jgi:hypothetical protein